MGIPYVEVRPPREANSNSLTSHQAPSEAEAQCAELARGGKVRTPIHSSFTEVI